LLFTSNLHAVPDAKHEVSENGDQFSSALLGGCTHVGGPTIAFGVTPGFAANSLGRSRRWVLRLAFGELGTGPALD